MNIHKATKRTFYIERYAESFNVIKVWEVGAEFTQQDVQDCMARVMNTAPDERIIAEQLVGISSSPGGVVVAAANPEVLKQTTDGMKAFLRGDQPGSKPEPNKE